MKRFLILFLLLFLLPVFCFAGDTQLRDDIRNLVEVIEHNNQLIDAGIQPTSQAFAEALRVTIADPMNDLRNSVARMEGEGKEYRDDFRKAARSVDKLSVNIDYLTGILKEQKEDVKTNADNIAEHSKILSFLVEKVSNLSKSFDTKFYWEMTLVVLCLGGLGTMIVHIVDDNKRRGETKE